VIDLSMLFGALAVSPRERHSAGRHPNYPTKVRIGTGNDYSCRRPSIFQRPKLRTIRSTPRIPSGKTGKHLLQAAFSHVAVLVTVFDFGGDPAADFVRMRMEPPFG
jgi:hypothetical protein